MSATQTGATMPSSPGMKQIRGEIAPANDAIASCGRVEALALSAEFQGVPQLQLSASSLRHARAKLRAAGARRHLAPISFHENRSSQTAPPTRRNERSSGARCRLAVGGFRSRTAAGTSWPQSLKRHTLFLHRRCACVCADSSIFQSTRNNSTLPSSSTRILVVSPSPPLTNCSQGLPSGEKVSCGQK